MNRPEKSYRALGIWVFFCAVICIIYSLYGDRIPVLYMGKLFGIICSVMLDILSLMVYMTGKVYWMNGITYEEAAAAGNSQKKKFAAKTTGIFLGCTVLEILYFLYGVHLKKTDLQKDSMVTAGILCAAVLLVQKNRLNEP